MHKFITGILKRLLIVLTIPIHLIIFFCLCYLILLEVIWYTLVWIVTGKGNFFVEKSPIAYKYARFVLSLIHI